MGVALELAQLDELGPVRGGGDDDEHGDDRRQAEGRGDQGHPGRAVPGSGIHDQRDKWLARAEDEDGEQDPGRDIGLLGFLAVGMDVRSQLVGVGMDVLMVVIVVVPGLRPVFVDGGGDAVVQMIVEVRMGVGLAPPGAAHAPDEIGEAEADEEPGRDRAPGRLDAFELGHGDAQGDADEAEDDRAEDVPQAGQEGDAQGLPQGPFAGPADDDERQVVVGADDGVDEAEPGRRAGQHPDLVSDHHSPADGARPPPG
ncbi:MAG: hypothetical protein MZV63_65955 [Marinilabiliales bacterium]|nr:hypothetical protein [Marinilabiliales bacterium]